MEAAILKWNVLVLMCFQGVLKVLNLLPWLVPVVSGNSINLGYFFLILLIPSVSCCREGRKWLEKRDTVLGENFCRVGELGSKRGAST